MSSIEHGGAPLHYELTDRRLPWASDEHAIVFHHGLGACAATWAGWESALSERCRMLRLDMRGHGRSPAPADYPWTIDALVDDLEAVVDAAALGAFHLVGESTGGTVALAYAARHPDRIRTLTVSNGAHRGGGIRNLSAWGDIIADGGMDAWSEHMMGMRFFDGAIDAPSWQWYRDQQATCDPHGVLALAAALAEADLGPALAAINRPVLLLHPDSSPFIPVTVMAELKEALPDARLEVFAHARHGLPFSHAGACARMLARHLALG